MSCHVSKGLVSEVTQPPLLHILLVKPSDKGRGSEGHISVGREATSPCQGAWGRGGLIAAIWVNNLAQSGWSGPRTLGCHISPPRGDTDMSGRAHWKMLWVPPHCAAVPSDGSTLPHPRLLDLRGQTAQHRPLPHGTEDRAMPSSALSNWEMDRATLPVGPCPCCSPSEDSTWSLYSDVVVAPCWGKNPELGWGG